MTDTATVEPADKTPMEYMGDMTFGPVNDGPCEPLMSHKAWMERAHGQYQLTFVPYQIIHGTDADVEAMVRCMIDREGDMLKGLEPYMEQVECLASNIKTAEAAADYFGAVMARLIIILERISGRDLIEASYGEDDSAA